VHPPATSEDPELGCPPFMHNDVRLNPADVAEYFFVQDPASPDQLVASPPTDWVAGGQTQTYTVKVKNMGTETWSKDGPNAVRLGVHFGSAKDDPPNGGPTDQRFDLPHDVHSGESATVTVTVTPPSLPGNYTLHHRLVKGDHWFDQINKTAVTNVPIIRASVGDNGQQANGPSYWPSVTTDKIAVAFTSNASNLVPDDTNGRSDIFVRSLTNIIPPQVSTIRISGGADNDESSAPSFSANGQWVAYDSWDRESNVTCNIFVRDLNNGTPIPISIGINGPANGSSMYPSISADGQRIAFQSNATNLFPGDNGYQTGIFVHDRSTGTTTRISVGIDGPANGFSQYPSISADGQVVAFASDADNLVPGDTNEVPDVFVYDLKTRQLTRVSVGINGQATPFRSGKPSLSAGGQVVAFDSEADNLVPGDTNGTSDVFIHDRNSGKTTRVSVGVNGQANGGGGWSSISGDGHRVAFSSYADDLVPGDTNGTSDVFIHDRNSGKTTRVSVGVNGQANGNSGGASISGDGHRLAFSSQASNLVKGDTNGVDDVFAVWLPD
jgi:Tol biopolymer transport system component